MRAGPRPERERNRAALDPLRIWGAAPGELESQSCLLLVAGADSAIFHADILCGYRRTGNEVIDAARTKQVLRAGSQGLQARQNRRQ